MAGLVAGLRAQAVFVAAGATDVIAGLSESQHPIGDAPVYTIDPRVAARLSTLETPAALMAVFAIPVASPLDSLLSPTPRRDVPALTPAADPLSGNAALAGSAALGGTALASTALAGTAAGSGRAALAVFTDHLADPGNMGTLVRAAAAFAAAALVASPGSVDLFSPKVVRAGMGAVFELPLYQDVTLERAIAELGAGVVYGLVAHGGTPIDRLAPPGDSARGGAAILVVGAERAGLSDEALACVTDLVTIPLAGATGPGVESLNAGVAGAIALYELSRRPAGPALSGGGGEPHGVAPEDPAPGGSAPRKE
jgi:tRNA G18 (ribose-2'-O)-methylase SpoU